MIQQLAQQWLLDNQLIVTGNISFRNQINEFFAAYNSITGENKTTTTCGRCIMNMKARLRTELNKINNMNKYPVYRTAKGNLSFKEQGEGIIFIIRSNSQHGADEALLQLKNFEKRESKKINE